MTEPTRINIAEEIERLLKEAERCEQLADDLEGDFRISGKYSITAEDLRESATRYRDAANRLQRKLDEN